MTASIDLAPLIVEKLESMVNAFYHKPIRCGEYLRLCMPRTQPIVGFISQSSRKKELGVSAIFAAEYFADGKEVTLLWRFQHYEVQIISNKGTAFIRT